MIGWLRLFVAAKTPGVRVALFVAAGSLGVGVAVLAAAHQATGDAPRAHAADVKSLFGAFTRLDRRLTKAIDEAAKGEDVANLIRRIEDDKHAIETQYMTTPIAGVAASTWTQLLTRADEQLVIALLVDDDALRVPGLGGRKKVIVQSIERAKEAKQTLENDLHKANGQPRCTGHAMLGNIYGGQAHQLVSDFTCPKTSTEFSLTVPSGYQITGGQASDAASSTGYSCNLNATNTTVDCTGTAPAASTTYVQMTTSPNPQAGMKLPLKVSFSDKSATSFTLTGQ